jgi:hypothetical protein
MGVREWESYLNMDEQYFGEWTPEKHNIVGIAKKKLDGRENFRNTF